MERDLALPVDRMTRAMGGRETSKAQDSPPPVPPPAPLAMPVQDLQALPSDSIPTSFRRDGATRVLFARLVTFGGALVLTLFATDQMIEAVAVGQVTALQWALVVLFVFSFAWIALSAASAVAGLLFGSPRAVREGEAPVTTRTALVMPVYNENPARTAAALAAMGRSLAEKGYGAAFELFILSDTTMPAFWVKETAAVGELRRMLAGRMAVWYRRRYRNTARKAGNLKDFVERWGGRYDFMIVLDADSIMAPETLVSLVRRMQADPSLGLLQTVPVLAGGQTLFSRLQQFAAGVYGPVVGRGLAAWQGDDGNYWGHNAIIRVPAFAASCGLPELAGRKPFGGAILSHDFVEAALLRRAGWAVRMAPDLGGSWEESPPSLLDVAARDRRWAQGNLQHLKVLRTRGLAWPSRVHFLIGIMSYLASPLWLALILVGIVLTLQAKLIRPEFFSEGFQLFPTWPQFDAQRMIWLFVFTIGVLLLPKFIGLGRALLNGARRRGSGGALALVGSTFFEILLSAVYAPILMLLQSRQVWEILLGRDSGWVTQRRDAGSTPWREVVRRHWLHSFLGLLASVLLWKLSRPLLAWMSPTLIGLLLALPLSRVSGSAEAGKALLRWHLLRIPEESDPPAIVAFRDALEPRFRDALADVGIASLLRDDRRRAEHFHYVLPRPKGPRGHLDIEPLAVEAKLSDAHTSTEAIGWLTVGEMLAVLNDRTLFEGLLRLDGDQGERQGAELSEQTSVLERLVVIA